MRSILFRILSWLHPFRSIRKGNQPFSTWKKSIYTLFELAIGFIVYSYALIVLFSPLYFQKIYSNDRFDFYALSDVSPQQISQILEHSSELLRQSPLNNPETRYKIFLPPSDRIFSFLIINFTDNPPLAVNIFNIYFRPSVFFSMLNNGETSEIAGIIAHEATHTDQRNTVGLIKILFTPDWIAEGYAENVRGQSRISTDDTVRYICAGDNRTDARVPQLYYAENRLLVKYLLEQKPNTALSIHLGDFNRDAVLVSLKEKICGVG